MRNIEDIVKESLERLYEEENEAGNDAQDQNDADSKGEGEGANVENGDESDFSAESLEDFLKKTDTRISVKKEGCMPSPIFGSRDSNNHNKYRITLENPNGKISFVFWDSLANTRGEVPLDELDALASFGNDVSAFESHPEYSEFKRIFGYDEAEENLAQKAYNGCRKLMDKAKKLYDEKQLSELERLSNER